MTEHKTSVYTIIRVWLEKSGFPVTMVPMVPVELSKLQLDKLVSALRTARGTIESGEDQYRHRISMILEELEEMIIAIVKQDIALFADGLGDLLFCVIALAATYDIPMDIILDRVIAANQKKGLLGSKPKTYDHPTYSDLFTQGEQNATK